MKFPRTKATIHLIAGIAFTVSVLAGSAHAATWLGSMSGLSEPKAVTVDGRGNVYVTDTGRRSLQVYDRKGTLLRTLSGLKYPIGLAVDAAGNIYIGNTVKSGTSYSGSVDVYTSGLTLFRRLGSGDGEFKKPGGIAVASNGMVYVADTDANLVKVYNANGTFAFSFGGYGASAGETGKFNIPVGLAVNEAASELSVLDHGMYLNEKNEPTSGARVQVFDLLTGAYKRTFGEHGSGPGKMWSPLGIALDAAGHAYITDIGNIFTGGQGVVHHFDAGGGFVETISDAAHPLLTPIGVAVGSDNRLFAANSGGHTVELFGLPGYTTLGLSETALAFSAIEGSGPSAPKSVSVINTGSGALDWSAASDRTWIIVQTASPTALNVSVNPAGLAVGAYSGAVTVTAATGAVETLGVTLSVIPPPPVLSVTPPALAFKAQEGGPLPAAQTINIHNLAAGAMSWTASTATPWLLLSALSGSAPSAVTVTVTEPLREGTHTGSVSITAPGATGSPLEVPVTVTVSKTGTVIVTTNLSQATFTLAGPATYNGSGTRWVSEDITPGQYTVTFGPVTGYQKPRAKTITVASGAETEVSGEYARKAAKTHLVIVSGRKTRKTVTVLSLADGRQTASFQPFSYPASNAQAACADLDGSGAEKIVVTDGVRSVKLYTADGAPVAALTLPKQHTNATLAVGDVDGDGTADILVGSTEAKPGKNDTRHIRQYSYAAGALEEKALLYSEEKNAPFTLALGDLDGDGAIEAILADQDSGVRAFTLSGSAFSPSPLWQLQGAFNALPQVAAGDLDGNGTAEVAVSDAGVVLVLSGAGTPAGLTIGTAWNKAKPEAASVALGDTDGDGSDELAVGSTPGAADAPFVRLYKGDGSLLENTYELKNAGDSGASVSLGTF